MDVASAARVPAAPHLDVKEAGTQPEDADTFALDDADVLLALDALRAFVDGDGDDAPDRLYQPGRDRLERRQGDKV